MHRTVAFLGALREFKFAQSVNHLVHLGQWISWWNNKTQSGVQAKPTKVVVVVVVVGSVASRWMEYLEIRAAVCGPWDVSEFASLDET